MNKSCKVWAGPILRRIEQKRLVIWLATAVPVRLGLKLCFNDEIVNIDQHQMDKVHTVELGAALFIYCLDLHLSFELPANCWIGYDLVLQHENTDYSWMDWAPDLVYPGEERPGFMVKPQIKRLAHGSCRKPHAETADGLVALDLYCEQTPAADWPSYLLMSGDQVYADDVAGPMLSAIHQLLPKLKIKNEQLPGKVKTSEELHGEGAHYYHRQSLLPDAKARQKVLDNFFGGIKKPIFTTVNGGNHLMSFAELASVYLLAWSPVPWEGVNLQQPLKLNKEHQARFDSELPLIEAFCSDLARVRRVLAHLPVAMIFDDHDVTDDWNLSIAWEEAAYQNPLSKRVIGNAMLAYLLFQGWGNAPEHFPANFIDEVRTVVHRLGEEQHEQCIDHLIKFRHWHYVLPTEPPIIVIDSRTNRWRSERSKNSPSGLMDWESITELQQLIIGYKAVIVLSPTPVFGVKLIETIQRIFTFFGKPLMVDAENWMSHRGSAYALMNIFRHRQTPENFSILSGDVHYSFVYKVELKGDVDGPNIWQITSSGLKNEFPRSLLDVLDRLNRWLYSPYSPLNWFTKRRGLRVTPYKPEQASRGERLVNDAGVGLVDFNEKGQPAQILHLSAKSGELTTFIEVKDSVHWIKSN